MKFCIFSLLFVSSVSFAGGSESGGPSTGVFLANQLLLQAPSQVSQGTSGGGNGLLPIINPELIRSTVEEISNGDAILFEEMEKSYNSNRPFEIVERVSTDTSSTDLTVESLLKGAAASSYLEAVGYNKEDLLDLSTTEKGVEFMIKEISN